MSLPDKNVWIGLFLGAVSATALGAVGPGFILEAFADESVATLNPANLVKFGGNTYSVTYEGSVATEPRSTAVVRKIGYGETSFVNIVTTDTGTYSSEALVSPHVSYPGVHVEKLRSSKRQWFGALSTWSAGGWIPMPLISGSSYASVRSGAARVMSNGGLTCVLTKNYSTCN